MQRLWVLIVVLLLPISVYAGPVGNLIVSFFKASNEEIQLEAKGVQNMTLLAATVSPLGGEQTTTPVVEKDALMADSGPLGSLAEILTHKPTSDQISVYVVRKGDTLSQIAEMFNVTVNTIKWSNDLSSNTLKEGQSLVILPISGVKYTVVKGDTLDKIAKKFNGDKSEIIAYNNIEGDSDLVVGAIIIVPDGEVQNNPASNYVPAGSISSDVKDYSGYYIRPIATAKRTQGLHGHNGIDLAAPVGTPIVAAAKGQVIISRTGGWNGGYGNYVVIRHSNGTQTLYAHNSRNTVSVGDNVEQGDIIGYIGTTGKATGPHLHFEVRGAKNPF